MVEKLTTVMMSIYGCSDNSCTVSKSSRAFLSTFDTYDTNSNGELDWDEMNLVSYFKSGVIREIASNQILDRPQIGKE